MLNLSKFKRDKCQCWQKTYLLPVRVFILVIFFLLSRQRKESEHEKSC